MVVQSGRASIGCSSIAAGGSRRRLFLPKSRKLRDSLRGGYATRERGPLSARQPNYLVRVAGSRRRSGPSVEIMHPPTVKCTRLERITAEASKHKAGRRRRGTQLSPTCLTLVALEGYVICWERRPVYGFCASRCLPAIPPVRPRLPAGSALFSFLFSSSLLARVVRERFCWLCCFCTAWFFGADFRCLTLVAVNSRVQSGPYHTSEQRHLSE